MSGPSMPRALSITVGVEREREKHRVSIIHHDVKCTKAIANGTGVHLGRDFASSIFKSSLRSSLTLNKIHGMLAEPSRGHDFVHGLMLLEPKNTAGLGFHFKKFLEKFATDEGLPIVHATNEFPAVNDAGNGGI